MVLYKEKLPELAEQAENYFEGIIHPGIPVPFAIEKRLQAGAQIAEICCGEGKTTILMAQTYPESFFTGIDPDYKLIMNARRRAKEAKLTGRVSFLVGSEKSYFNAQYDIIITHPAFYKAGNPSEITSFVREKLREKGAWLIVTPLNGDNEEHLYQMAEQNGFFTSIGNRKRRAG